MICGMWLRVKYFNTFIVIICINFLGFKKKIDALAKKKDREKLSEWSRSMVNHLSWSVTSSNGNQEEIKEKWLSLSRHIHNRHTRHGKIYKKCSHSKNRRKWFKDCEFL